MIFFSSGDALFMHTFYLVLIQGWQLHNQARGFYWSSKGLQRHVWLLLHQKSGEEDFVEDFDIRNEQDFAKLPQNLRRWHIGRVFTVQHEQAYLVLRDYLRLVKVKQAEQSTGVGF